MPERFRCKVGGEWRKPHHFSKTQLAKWQNRKKSPNDGVTAANIGITCREHSGEPTLQLQCLGPCGLLKSRDKFSSSQRRNNLRWCVGCIRWQLQQSPDAVPVAAPNGFVSQDEINGETRENEILPFEVDRNETAASDNGSDDLETDNEDEGGPAASQDGYFSDDGYGEPDDEDIRADEIGGPPVETMALLAISSAQPALQSVTPNVPSTRAAISSYTSGSTGYGPSSQVAATPDAAATWVPDHLRLTGNVNALRDLGASSRTSSASAKDVGSGIPPHPRGVPRSAPTATATSGVLVGRSAGGSPNITRDGAAGNQDPTHDTADSSRVNYSTTAVSSTASRVTMSAKAGRYVPDYLFHSQVSGSSQFRPRTSSVVSSDSQAGVPSVSTAIRVGRQPQAANAASSGNYHAYDPQGNPHIRNVERPRSEATALSSRPPQSSRHDIKVLSSGFAKPDRRKQFGTAIAHFPRDGVDAIHTYESGSDDEF
ncbi:hypothetical protein BJ170DRAFT_711383 [Xylariales sp. AK1849]|nr:hypothetical protein BJ170DRAFT_711383 [Xylariales sp. AK1849]